MKTQLTSNEPQSAFWLQRVVDRVRSQLQPLRRLLALVNAPLLDRIDAAKAAPDPRRSVVITMGRSNRFAASTEHTSWSAWPSEALVPIPIQISAVQRDPRGPHRRRHG